MLTLEADAIEFRMAEDEFWKSRLGFLPTQRDTFTMYERVWRLRSLELIDDGSVKIDAVRVREADGYGRA